MTGLLDPAFVRELELLRRRLRLRVASGGGGEHMARRRGSSAEFLEHRAYEPGDDLRRVDWAAYARTGEPVIKLFRAEEDVIVRLLIDTSASLEGEKLDAAVRIAAAVGYMGLASSERVQMFPFAGIVSLTGRPLRGRAGVGPLLKTLEGLTAGGATNLDAAIERAVAKGRAGLVVVISDFFDPSGFEKPLLRARASGNDVVIVQVVSREEVEPTLHGDVLLEDAETGRTITLTADADAVESYLARMEGLRQALGTFARTHGATFVRHITDQRVDHTVRGILDRRIDV